MPDLFWWQWALGALCAANVGIAKTGVPGMGVMVVPLMVLTVGDARLSAGWLLPVLCAADVLAIWYWRRHAAVGRLFSLAPYAAAGMIGGALTLSLNEFILRRLVGVIIGGMLAVHLWRRYSKTEIEAHPLAYGVAAGYSSTVANAAGPVMNLYLLSQKLPKEEFVATGAWFFFFVNLTKIPIYLWHGLISRQSLMFDAAMIPAILLGALIGRFVLYRISAKVFENSVLVLTLISTLLLFR